MDPKNLKLVVSQNHRKFSDFKGVMVKEIQEIEIDSETNVILAIWSYSSDYNEILKSVGTHSKK